MGKCTSRHLFRYGGLRGGGGGVTCDHALPFFVNVTILGSSFVYFSLSIYLFLFFVCLFV